jgi:hypothetical protein
VVVSVSRDMMISLAEKSELFMKRTDGRMTRFRRADVDTFKQYSDNRRGLAHIHRYVINREGHR